MRRKTNKRALLAAAVIVLLLTAAIGGTLAYLATSTQKVENVFTPADVTSAVVEPSWTDGKTTKSNVTIQNTGDVSAFIRAAIVVTWQDENGNVLSVKPRLETDYTLEIGSSWTKDGDYYYYNAAVAAGAQTANLIKACTVIAKAPIDGYTLHVEVIGSAIQSEGMGAADAKLAFDKAGSGN